MQTGLLGLIAFFPLLGALVNGLTGGRLPKPLSGGVATLSMVASFVLSIAATWLLVSTGADDGHGHVSYTPLLWEGWTWMAAGSLDLSFSFAFDTLTAVMALVITGVGLLIHVFSIGYMHEDEGFGRYFAYLNLFVFAMLCLVLGDSLPVLFLGWEGVGVASYLLIGFWYQENANADAAKKAFIVNRIGDAALLLGMFTLYWLTGGLEFSHLNGWLGSLSATDVVSEGSPTGLGWVLTLAAVLIFIGCTGKSAQLPLFTWLPDAMAGPTPVSALIHAATMVTAGVYLIARLSGLFALAPYASLLVAVVGTGTALFAATIAVTQNDIKKVLAYSTVSQLGFMFAAVGSGAFFAGVFHLMTHAFFKALLFLGSGAVIHGLQGEQDIRRMGGLRKSMPLTALTFLVGCLAIAGVPPLSGFFSKDEILWFVLSNTSVTGLVGGWVNWLLWASLLVTAALTAFYMFRLYFVVFEGESRVDADVQAHIHREPLSMALPLVVLAGLAVVGGFAGVPHLLGGPLPVWWLDLHGWLHSAVGHGEALYASQFGGDGLAWLSLGAALVSAAIGIVLARTWYGSASEAPAAFAAKLGKLYTGSLNKWYVDELYEATIGRAYRLKALVLHRFVDEFAIDLAGVGGTAWGVRFLGTVVRQFQNGDVQRYAVMTVLGLGVIVYLLV